MQDSLGNTVTTGSAAALRQVDAAIDLHARGWPGALDAAEAATREDPELSIAHALQGLIHAMWGRRPAAAACMSRARAPARAISSRESSLLELLEHVVRGRTHAGLAWLLAHLRRFPTDLLALTPGMGAYGLFAFSGRADHNELRLALLDELEPSYPREFAWLLAYRGWARIELGAVDEGLAMALRAISMRPQNAHNAHIVAHGFHEGGRPAEYLAFLSGWLPDYPADALMWGHLQWHATIAELEIGDEHAARERCARQLMPHLPKSAPFMGLADGPSILWRLGLRGKAALPWDLVVRHARDHFPNGANPFGEIHLAMIASATGDHEALVRCAQRLERLASDGHLGAHAALKWVAALDALLAGRRVEAERFFEECEVDAVRLGGSRAQRGVISETRRASRVPA
jgi:tetratricopeptide (TPR) repeat protein